MSAKAIGIEFVFRIESSVFSENSLARKIANKFAFSLAYSYLWLRRKYFRSENCK